MRIHHKLGYSSLNIVRSALSAAVHIKGYHGDLGTHPKICRFLTAVFQMTPPVPKYNIIWDVSLVLSHLKTWSPGKHLTLKQLSAKVVTLIALITGQRVQTLNKLHLDNMVVTKSQVTFIITEKLKTTRPGHQPDNIVLARYRDDPRICVLNYLAQYIKRVKPYRSTNYLFVSLNKPHDRVSNDTLARWIKYTLQHAGIDTSIYSAHSCRTASSSAAHRSGLNINQILRNCGWSNERTFAKWYQKPVTKDPTRYQRTVLQSASMSQ